MIIGAHSIIYSSDANADMDFFKNVLKFPYVDAGRGWLIFRLPPSEVAIHPAAKNGHCELYFLCDDLNAFIKQMDDARIICSEVEIQQWGAITYLTLPGGGKLGVYEPTHDQP
jgi:hypothetical protein